MKKEFLDLIDEYAKLDSENKILEVINALGKLTAVTRMMAIEIGVKDSDNLISILENNDKPSDELTSIFAGICVLEDLLGKCFYKITNSK